MAIGAITMILTNVGLQVYNNWCGSRQNAELQRKREEFELAAKERNTEHMWKLLREGQELTMQLEEERHQHRLHELKEDIDNLLQKLTYETAISNWPLRVLPIVMKNQTVGNLLANQEECIAMHVIFTRSNYDMFNNRVYPIIERKLGEFCEKHWSISSNHPILFYSGAWKPLTAPTDVQVSSMRTALINLPTVLITPFFRPGDGKLVFQVNMWGVEASGSNPFNIPEIEPTDFQRQFTNRDDYENTMGLFDEIIEDMVPYLQCLIGFIADTYFWSSSGLAPHLPLLVTNGTINTDGMKYLVRDSSEYYKKLLLSSEDAAKLNPFSQNNLLNLFEGSSELLNDVEKKSSIEDIFLLYCNSRTQCDNKEIEYVLNNTPFSYNDIKLLNKLRLVSNEDLTLKLIETRINEIKNKIHCTIIENDDLAFEDILFWCNNKYLDFPAVQFVSIEIQEDRVVAAMLDKDKNYIDDELNPMVCVFTYDNLVVPDFVVIKNKNLIMSINKLLMFYNQIIY